VEIRNSVDKTKVCPRANDYLNKAKRVEPAFLVLGVLMVTYSEAPVGESLRESRAASGLTLNEAAGYCSIPLTYMLKIEAGSSGPTAEVLRQLIRLYSSKDNAPATQPPGIERRSPQNGECEIDWVGLVKTASTRTNSQILEDVAHGVRALRGLGQAIPVIMRDVEADIMISLLDVSDPHLPVDIMQAFSLSAMQADELLASSVRRFERRALPTDIALLERLQMAPSTIY
jgi:transcriptional regulator with XRE-family HTH domain